LLESGNVFATLSLRSDVRELICSFEPDVVHHFSTGAATFFTTGHGLPTVTSLQQRLPDSCKQADSLVYRTLDQSGWITTCSARLQATVCELLPHKAAVCSAVLNSIPLPDIEPSDAVASPARLLAVGRLTEQKGFDIAIRALPEIVMRYPQACLEIAGDGPDRESLIRLTDELGVADHVCFLGLVDRQAMVDLLDNCSLVVMPSRWEGLPVAAVEAAAMARAVVASNVDGIPEILLDGRTGRLVKEESPPELAAAVCELLARPEALREMGRQARQHARESFSLESCVDGYEAVYRRFDPRSAVQSDSILSESR
jgi:glycosyltransferase involved in cell wall biosynthesis